MEMLLTIWTAAPELKIKLMVLAILLQMVITIWCYAQMSRARMAGYKEGRTTPEIYKAVGDSEPEEIRVYTRLVANQFEMPVLFYALVVTGLAIGATSWITVVLAFIYILMRYLHAKEMMGDHVVMRRRKIFIQSARIILFMMVELAISTLFFI